MDLPARNEASFDVVSAEEHRKRWQLYVMYTGGERNYSPCSCENLLYHESSFCYVSANTRESVGYRGYSLGKVGVLSTCQKQHINWHFYLFRLVEKIKFPGPKLLRFLLLAGSSAKYNYFCTKFIRKLDCQMSQTPNPQDANTSP